MSDAEALSLEEKRLARQMSFYASYLRDDKAFDRATTDQALGTADDGRFTLTEKQLRQFCHWYLTHCGAVQPSGPAAAVDHTGLPVGHPRRQCHMTTHAQAAGRVPALASALASALALALALALASGKGGHAGGYVSVMAYRVLYRRLRREVDQGRAQITIVAPDAYHSFHGWTGEVLGGVLPEGRQKGSLREASAAVPASSAVRLSASTWRPGGYVSASTTRLDHHEVHYDHLVLGHGTQDDLDSVPGLAEHMAGR